MTDTPAETLRTILENIHNPDALDAHPWASRVFVKDAVTRLPNLGIKSLGHQLVDAVMEFFAKTIPTTPPRRGKRLDTRWGEFGILAAQYFAPMQFGTPVPSSLRDAWGRIDQVILQYVFGCSADLLTEKEINTYKLVGDELDVAPSSTLSDWHSKGIQKLADALQKYDQYIEKLSVQKLQPPENSGAIPPRRPKRRKIVATLLLALVLLFLFGMVWGGLKARRIYNQAMLVWQNASQIRDQASASPSLEIVKAIGPGLTTLREDFQELEEEVKPFLWLMPWLDWVPVYGRDLASAQDLVMLADALLASVDQSYQALSPMLIAYGEGPELESSVLVGMLEQAEPHVLKARVSLGLAIDARARLDPQQLSPRVRDLILNDVDWVIGLMNDGLIAAVEIPRILGASSEGPKTYLLLAQNEDELRPTGGFITAAGTLLVQDGQIVSLTFVNSGYLENWDRPYPAAPWQLQQYMNSPVLIFRDANWFTDFRTAALYAEYLYSYNNNHSVDGVIAFDQHLLVEILSLLGPIELGGEVYPIDANNVVSYMRSEKILTTEDILIGERDSKAFMNKIIVAMIEKLLSGQIPLDKLSRLLVKVLNERHLLLQLDNPALTDLIDRHGWSGAVQPTKGDFLMVVDSNVGFNKTNAIVESSLFYDVDLTNLQSPVGDLVVLHKNNAAGINSCSHWEKVITPGEEKYPITDCYWNYLRVYALKDTKLLGANVQTVPAEWTILKREVPPQVDILDEEIGGVGGFGTLKVVPGGQSLATNFRFALPASVLENLSDSGQVVYRLKIQKQPGTLGVPITIRVHLPNGATAQTVPPGAVVQGQNILFQASLVTDIELEFIFLVP